jgi:polar amino acid transport system substrate-binding protein
MQQVLQDNKGHLEVAELPEPAAPERGVLVRNSYSLISAGTERAMVTLAEKSLVAKAQARPELARQVIAKMKTEGVLSTFRKVQARLHKPVPLGYSSAGRVTVSTCEQFATGDRVACAGFGYASHAGFVSVPQNLTVRIPEGVSERAAATVTLGAVALQGVRIANPRLGETVAVIGLGLLGQLTTMLLVANGCRVIGFDPAASRAEQARQHGADVVTTDASPEAAMAATAQRGVDAVIITAATKSNAPIELAAAICRDKGCLVIVGDVPANLPRAPFYHKELELRFARSYGPGRYDSFYEEQGHDYPYGYVRWTEQRNMEAYLALIAVGKVDAEALITHTFPIEDALAAYDIVMGKNPQPHLGILLSYPDSPATLSRVTLRTPRTEPRGRVRIGFIGAGNFATGVLLPALRSAKAELQIVCNRTGVTATAAARQFRFAQAATDPEQVFADPGVDLVFIASPHNLHASQAQRALQAQKAVFVEKPLAVTPEELQSVAQTYAQNPQLLMVGFNRRFAPLTHRLMETFAGRTEPIAIHYRILAGRILASSPHQDPATGGRIVGELCHFADYCRMLAGAPATRLSAESLMPAGEIPHSPDNFQVMIKFADGSVATISYIASADATPGKEEITVMGSDRTAVLTDFRSLRSFVRGREREWTAKQDKGHRDEIRLVLESVKQGKPMPIPFSELCETTALTFAVHDALGTGETIDLTRRKAPYGP